jgi:hypothetical protein
LRRIDFVLFSDIVDLLIKAKNSEFFIFDTHPMFFSGGVVGVLPSTAGSTADSTSGSTAELYSCVII